MAGTLGRWPGVRSPGSLLRVICDEVLGARAGSLLWQHLSSKSLYKIKFERRKIQMVEEMWHAVYATDGWLAACRKRLTELKQSMCAKGDTLNAAAQELDNLKRVRLFEMDNGKSWMPSDHQLHGLESQLLDDATLQSQQIGDKVCKLPTMQPLIES